MAQKHKSKYKAPKDLEKSQKPKTRKDLKDYTLDDKDGKLNPKSTGDKQLNVLRKTDKEVVDTGKLDIKYDADDRLYKELEDGNYDPKTAATRLKKRQDSEEKEIKDVIKDKIENLTREQKERLVREYIRRKIQKVLIEQATTPEEETPAEETPTADATATPPAEETPAADATATPPATDAAVTPPATDTAATPPAGEEPAAETPEPSAEDDEQEKDRVITDIVDKLQKEGDMGIIKMLSRILAPVLKNREFEDQAKVLRLIRKYSIQKLSTLGRKNKK